MNFGSMLMPVEGKSCRIGAGSYVLRPAGTIGIKLAREIDESASARVDLYDMSAPEDPLTDWQLRGALLLALYSLSRGRGVYVGCMGGYGRTGLFLACLVKCLGVDDPVGYVRAHYHGRAVETDEQLDYVAEFDPGLLRLAVAGARARAGWGQNKSENPYIAGGYIR